MFNGDIKSSTCRGPLFLPAPELCSLRIEELLCFGPRGTSNLYHVPVIFAPLTVARVDNGKVLVPTLNRENLWERAVKSESDCIKILMYTFCGYKSKTLEWIKGCDPMRKGTHHIVVILEHDIWWIR